MSICKNSIPNEEILLMRESEDNATSNQSSIEPDDEGAQAALDKQLESLRNLKFYLLSQQLSLKEKLHDLNGIIGSNEKLKVETTSEKSPEMMQEIETSSNQPQYAKNSADPSNADGITQYQSCSSNSVSPCLVCPLCGKEFDCSGKPSVLEDHVAQHWCVA